MCVAQGVLWKDSSDQIKTGIWPPGKSESVLAAVVQVWRCEILFCQKRFSCTVIHLSRVFRFPVFFAWFVRSMRVFRPMLTVLIVYSFIFNCCLAIPDVSMVTEIRFNRQIFPCGTWGKHSRGSNSKNVFPRAFPSLKCGTLLQCIIFDNYLFEPPNSNSSC